MSILREVLAVIGSAVVIVGILGFLAKTFLGFWADRKLEDFRSTLDKDVEKFKSALERDIEGFKNRLQLAGYEHQVTFSKLHDVRAETLAETYRLLVLSQHRAQEYFQPFEAAGDTPKSVLFDAALQAFADYFIYFDTRRIYLSPALCSELENFAQAVRKPMMQFEVYRTIEDPTPETARKKTELWVEGWNSIKEGPIQQLRADIEAEFRRLLEPPH